MEWCKGGRVGFQDLSAVACIHGRFQPFHLGHVDYLRACLARWDSVLVGIAAPTPVQLLFPGVEHRNKASANPLTYLERTILIRECCRELGVEDARIEFSPFPIDEPTLLYHYVPKSVVCATTRLHLQIASPERSARCTVTAELRPRM